ncbi:MAG: 1-acyl-sn-glycerol-3-phosphate acyltransferase [Bacilli bacterium]|nr:1-acyl-sn-glycerol-3-phosphate acyltransferase [Bacilli bacterium]
MILTTIVIILSLGLTSVLFYFNEWYLYWYMYWTLIVFPFAFFCALFALYIFYLAIHSAILQSRKFKKPSMFAQVMVAQTAFLIMKFLRFRLSIRGMGKLPEGKRRFMVVNNHLSVFDEFALIYAFRNHDMLYISKEANFRIPIAGPWLKASGHLPIKQDDMVSGTQVIEKAAEYIKSGKYSVSVAPEGTRNKDFPNTLMLPFKPGTFNLAKEAHCPIVVVAIQNTNAMIERYPLHGTRIYLDVVGVIDEEEVEARSSTELAEKARNLILKRFEEKGARFYHLKPKKGKKEPSEEEQPA